MKIRCVTITTPDDRSAELTIGEAYEVLGIEAGDFRIINDSGEPVLYPPELFEIVDDRRPNDWVVERGEEGEEYAYPPAFNAPGFWEDYFEHEPSARRVFSRFLNDRLRLGAA